MTQATTPRAHTLGITGGRSERTQALSSLGPVLYAARVSDGVIKIGYTTNLSRRLGDLAYRYWAGRPELLAFKPGTLADEQALHARLAAHRARGREWYRSTPEVLAAINEMRAFCGLAPIVGD